MSPKLSQKWILLASHARPTRGKCSQQIYAVLSQGQRKRKTESWLVSKGAVSRSAFPLERPQSSSPFLLVSLSLSGSWNPRVWGEEEEEEAQAHPQHVLSHKEERRRCFQQSSARKLPAMAWGLKARKWKNAVCILASPAR